MPEVCGRDCGPIPVPAAGAGQGALGGRPGPANHRPGGAVGRRPVQQRLPGGLVVHDATSEDPFPVIVEDLGEMLLLADI